LSLSTNLTQAALSEAMTTFCRPSAGELTGPSLPNTTRSAPIGSTSVWTLSGYGILTLSYLPQAPQAFEACYVTGGLASLHPDAAEV
jgi:hypothetical protein